MDEMNFFSQSLLKAETATDPLERGSPKDFKRYLLSIRHKKFKFLYAPAKD